MFLAIPCNFCLMIRVNFSICPLAYFSISAVFSLVAPSDGSGNADPDDFCADPRLRTTEPDPGRARKKWFHLSAGNFLAKIKTSS
jgi:hypothetical protein